MFSKLFFLISIFLMLGNPSSNKKTYHKEYYANGNVKAEGWTVNGNKVDFWKLYHVNGKLSEKGHYKNNIRENYWYFYGNNGKPRLEGHYYNGKMVDWWLYYDKNGKLKHKCQLNKGVKNGYCLQYEDEKLASAEKYRNGKKIKEWFSLKSFKKENNLSDLR